MASDLEAASVEQSSILSRCKARMIERLVLEGERARALAMLGSGVEHEHSIVSRMHVECREHRSLRLVRKVEVAVPAPSLTQLACSGASPRTVDEFCQLLAIGKRSLAPRSLHHC